MKSHPFFKDFDFAKLYNKTLVPPYKPKPATNISEIGALDPVASREGLVASQISETKLKEIMSNQEKFKDFQ